ncbi:MAG: hypothetical protein WCB11_30440 [Terriglobales bacterium]|jgi:hypothetical protein
MKEPGLDNRHRDKAKAKAGEIQQKRGIVHEIIESGLGGPGGPNVAGKHQDGNGSRDR